MFTTASVKGALIDLGAIRPLLQRIWAEFRPVEVRLFGSRARGEARAASDWDLFVVVPDESAALADDLFAGYRLRRELGIPADIVLCPNAEFLEDRDTPNTLAFEAAHHGVRIHER